MRLTGQRRIVAKMDQRMALVDALGNAARRLPRHRREPPLRPRRRTDPPLTPMPATKEPAPPLNHVFVDFENVHQIDVSVIGAKSVNFTLLLGAKLTRLDAGLAEKLMEHAASVQFVRLASSGKNALDFTLAYYVGRTVSADPAAYIHIVSKDTGFDPLVEHLRSRHIHARRHDSFATLTFSGTAKAAIVALKAEPAGQKQPLNRVLEHLRKNVANRPKRQKTLLSHLKSQLGKDATDTDAAGLLGKLQKGGHLSMGDKDAVTYQV